MRYFSLLIIAIFLSHGAALFAQESESAWEEVNNAYGEAAVGATPPKGSPQELLLSGEGEPGLIPEEYANGQNANGSEYEAAEEEAAPADHQAQDHNLLGEENACRVFDVECQCINPERDVVVPSRAFGRQDVEREPCLSPKEIDNLVKAQANFRCLREIEGAVESTCTPEWTCRVPCRLYTER